MTFKDTPRFRAIAIGVVGLVCIAVGIYFATRNSTPNMPPHNSDSPAASLQEDEQETPSGWTVVRRGGIPVDQQWTSAGTVKGRVIVIVWGRPTLNPKEGRMRPDGIDTIAGQEFALPGVRAFCTLARVNGSISMVGRYKEFSFPVETELFLGPNEEPGRIGQGFADNSGSWTYKICVQQ